jgi:hypothetical protein
MFTLSVVLGSSILYKDFNSATPERLLKFIFGCASTFIGVYFITSKRPTHTNKLRNPSIAVPNSIEPETEPLRVVRSLMSDSSDDTAEFPPPHLIGTSFGYHFASSPRRLERKDSRSSVNGTLIRRDDLPSAIWLRWGSPHDEFSTNGRMGRSQSEHPVPTQLRYDEEENHNDVITSGRGRSSSIL